MPVDVFDQVTPDQSSGDVFDQVAPATPSPIQQFESGVGDVARKSVQKPALPSDLTPWPTISPEEKAARAKEMDDALSKMTWKDYVAGAFNVATDPQMGGSQPLSKPGTNIKTHAEQAATPGTRLAGAGGLVGDVGDLASPLLGIGALESPVSTAVGLGTGMAGGKGARAVTKAAGGGEGAQDLAENLGYWIPALTGAVVRPRVGVGVTPEEVVIRGGVNPPGVGPKAGEIRIPRGPKPAPPAPVGTTIEPPTIEGNAQPMTREEAVEHLEANRGTPTVQNPTGWDPDLAKPVPEAPKATIQDENKVPKAQRASTLIKQDEQAKLAQAMEGRGAAKEALEKGDVFDKVTANEKPASVPQTDQPATSVPAAEGEGTPAASAPPATTGGGGAVPEAVRPAEDVPGQRETPASPSFDTPEFRAHKAAEDAYVEQAKKLLPENPSNKDLIAKVMELKKAGGGSPASGPSVAGEKPPQDGQLEGKRPLQVSKNGKNDRPADFAETPEKDVFDEVAQYKHRSTQANIPEDSEASQGLGIARSIIAKDDLMGKGRDIGGDHVTVRYGLKADSDVEGVRKYLASQEPFEATLGKTDIFPPSESSDGAAVVHAPIESPDLQRINGEIQKHGDFAESNFKDYKPHATIAYVKPDKSGRYKGMKIVEGKKFKVDTIHITDREGKAEPVKLEGKSKKPVTPQVKPSYSYGLPSFVKPIGALPGSREFSQEAYKKQKTALTRAINLTDPQAKRAAVLKAATQAVKDWGDKAWPDDSSRWQRALEDVGIHAQLEDLETASEADLQHGPLVIKTIRGTTERVNPALANRHVEGPPVTEIHHENGEITKVEQGDVFDSIDTGGKISTGEQQDQPERTAGGSKDLPSVPSPESESGNAPTPVQAEGNLPTKEGRDVEPSPRPADGERVERPARQPRTGKEPERSGGSGPPAHPTSERAAGGARQPRPEGADGRAVESPTPEEPEQAKETTAELRNQRNYRISDEYAAKIGTGGEITKIKGNLDALETLKKIQAEGRELATPEEQETIAKYVDFGGLVGMLQRHWESQYAAHYQRFTSILTPDEIQEIRETLPNTHYTSMQVVDWMWDAMKRMGFRGGRVLEPGMGIGNFFGRIPEKIAGRSELFGVERNPLTGGMTKLLYPDANIQVKPFQKFQIPNNSIDAVIGNVPFQDVTITDDPAYKDMKLNLHNYFIVKALDKLRPGGIAALITSRYTMDASKGAGYRAREEMAKRADLIAAIRLPDQAFKRTAGTEVVADLLVFRKRDPEKTFEKESGAWTGVEPIKVGEKEFMVNRYFAENPQNVLGKHSSEGSMYGPAQYTVKGPADFAESLKAASELFPKGVFGKQRAAMTPAPHTVEPSDLDFAPEDVKPGAYFKDAKGNVRIKQSGVGVQLPENLRSVDKLTHIGHAIDLRDQLNQTIATQLETADDEPLKAAQKQLGKLYDAYNKKYGPLHGSKLKQVFGDDPEYPKLLALENIDTENKQVTKASIFSKRVLAPYEPLRDLPDDPKSSMLKVIAERGYLDTKLMADLLKKDEADVIANLENEGLIFQDPQSGVQHTADDYLSGNVRDKLRVAELAAETDNKFSRNVEALQKAQPKPLTIHDIQPNLGQTWIPMQIYRQFVRQLANSNRLDVEISRDSSGKWLVQAEGNRNKLENAWSGGGISGHKLVQAALNQQQPTVWDRDSDGTRHLNAEKTTAAREKLAAIKEEFRTVLRRATPEIVNKLEQIYNDTFNAFKLREFSGEHLDFPGMSEEWRGKIRGYQKSAVWRILQEGRAGIFHAPGLGKTLTMVAAGMEARRLKLSRKNMYAVPNHMVPQWREDFKRFYPNANVLAVNDDDFTATNRAKLMSRIATGDWDAIIVPHSQYDLLPMSPEWEAKTIDKRLSDYRSVLEELDPNDDKRTIKQIEKAVDKLESRLNELNSKKKDNTIAFDQLGVDMMFVDEAHAYKAMAVPSKMGNVGGLSNRASERAFALEMKADFMRDTHKGRGTVFGTGTPITNTVGELYVMTKYLAPEMLEAAGIRSFDDWAANFATTITQWEYGADGVTFKPKTSLSEFVNVPELSTMFRRFAEYLSKSDAKKLSNLKEPAVKRTDRMVKITPTQEPLLEMIADRGEHLTKHPPKTKEERQHDNWLKLSGDARKISLDPRLYNPALRDDPGSKANQAVRDIKDVLDRTAKEKGTVVVFSDFFQHKGPDDKPDFNLFEDMKRKLAKQGVPAEQVAIIHDAANKEEKEALFVKVRSGKIRVLIGSTEKMGIGTNIQDRLKAELHLDQPWRPDQVEQREGRIERSGNMWDDVEIYRYIAEPEKGTVMRWDDEKQAEVEKPRPRAYDLQMYQQLARKANFQEQFLTGNYNGRTMEDVGGDAKLNSQMFQLAKAMATGNPDALKKIKIEHDLRTFSMLERNFQVEQSQNVRRQENLQMKIPIIEKKIQMLKRDADLWEKAEAGSVGLDIGGKVRSGEELKDWLDTEPSIAELVDKPLKVGGIQSGIEELAGKKRDEATGKWMDEVDYRYRIAGELHQVPTNTVKSFLNSFAQQARMLGVHRENSLQDLRDSKEKLASISEEVKRTSPYIDKIEKMEKEIAEINTRLGMTSSAEADEGADQGEDDEKPDKPAKRSSEAGFATVGAINPLEVVKSAKKVYSDFIDKIIREKLDLGDKYRRVAEHDKAIASMLHEKDNAPRYFRDKADSNVTQVTKGLSEDQVRLTAMMADNQIREYLQEEHPDQYDEARNDPAVMKAVQTFKKYQDELAALRIKLGWHVRRDLSSIENEDGTWSVVDQDGDEVDSFKTFKQSQDYVEDNGKLLDHLKRTYPEHMREPLMGATNEPSASGAPYGGIRPPRPDKKQRIASAEYFFQHGAKDFAGYVKSFTQAYHAALNQKIYDSLTGNAELWKEGTALPPQIEYRGKTYYSPDVAKSMKLAKPENRPKVIEEYRAYDPARDDKALIKSFEDGWSTQTTGRPGISPSDRYLAPKDVVDALDHYDMTRGVQEGDSIRRFFQEQIVGLFGPTVHVFNIMRRLAHVAGGGVWDPRAWPMLVKLFVSSDLRERMAQGLADDAIDSLSKWGAYTNARDIGSLHSYFLGNLNPANWSRMTIGKFSKGTLFDPKFLGGFGGLDQKARVLAFDYFKEHENWNDQRTAREVEDEFGNYNKANWTQRMFLWAKAILFPGWDFSSLKWFLRHPIKTAMLPAIVTVGANLALNKAGKNKDQDKYDYGYLHWGDRKLRTGLITEAMAMHIMEPLLAGARAALEGGGVRDVLKEADEGLKRGAGGVAGNLRPELTYIADMISNRKYPGGTTEIYKPQDSNIPGKLGPWSLKTDKEIAFTITKAFPAVSRFLDSSGASVDVATGLGSVIGVTNYKSGAEERLRANAEKSKSASQTLSVLAESDPDAASKFVEDPQKAMDLTFNKDFSELEGALKDIDKQSEQVKLAPGISKSDRDEALKGLEESRKQVLNSADAIADAMQAARLQMKK